MLVDLCEYSLLCLEYFVSRMLISVCAVPKVDKIGRVAEEAVGRRG